MTRNSRAESQQRTRAALVDTAWTLFLRDGYAATSLGSVADAAGYSKGAVYSNFRNKDELCLAVLTDIYTRDIAALTQAVTGAACVEERMAALETWANRTLGSEGRTVLEVEFSVRVRHSERMRARLAALDRHMADVLADLIEVQATELGVTPLLPSEVVASALLNLGIGISIQRVVEPEFSVRVLLDTVRALLGLAPRDPH